MTVIRICVQAGRERLWWIGPCPWPGIPVGFGGETVGEIQSWQCCPDDGPVGTIADVQLHLPRNDLDIVFTVTVDVDDSHLDHYTKRHGFDAG